MDEEDLPSARLPRYLLGSKATPQRFKCGGWTGCDEDHDFLAPEDVLVLTEALPLEAFRESHHWRQDLEDKAVADKTLYIGRISIIPTMLGMWFEDASVN